MSTDATVPNVQTQTPEQIAQQIADQNVQQPQGGEPTQLQREYVVETATGQVFRGKTQQELIDQLKKSVENATPLIAEYNRIKKTGEAQSQPAPQPEGFDPGKYYEMWGAGNPAAADDYKMKALYGVTMQEAVQALRESSDFTRRVEPQTVIAQWQATSDFPTSDEAERDKAAKAMEAVWTEKFPDGAKVTESNLEMIHATAVQRGLYRTEKQLTGGQQQVTPTATPTLQGSSFSMNGQQVNPATMKPDQLRQYIESLNGQR